jgi:hypothetical protein
MESMMLPVHHMGGHADQHVMLQTCWCRYRIYHLYYPGTPMGLSLWILVFGGCQIFISLVSAAGGPLFTQSAVVSAHHQPAGPQTMPSVNEGNVMFAQLRNFNSLRGISFLAAVMSLGYSTIATGDPAPPAAPARCVYSGCTHLMSSFSSLSIKWSNKVALVLSVLL